MDTLSLDGVWAENDYDNALFVIGGDSVRNIEHNDLMYFKTVRDTLIIDYEGFVGKRFILKHTKDSLVLRNEDNSVLCKR